jgi:predicted ABC-type ATPase
MTPNQARRTNRILIIAGPNGAGKTTFAQEFLPHEADCLNFINADLIARGISPFAPDKGAIQAGKIMLTQIASKVSRRESFSFETTPSGRNYARHIPRWREAGYHVKLIFLSLPSAELALARVRSRAAQGGHDVPEKIVRRRFDAGLRNFESLYRTLVDAWAFYDNSGPAPVLIAAGDNQ